MQKSNIFIFFGIFYIFWIFLNNILENIYTSLFVSFVILVFFLCVFFYIRKYLLLFVLSTLWFVIWAYVSDFNLEQINKNLEIVNNYFDKNTKIEVEIKSVSKISDERITYIWEIKSLDSNILKNIKAEININWNEKLEKWTIIKLETKIYKYEPFDSFEYEKYMFSKGLYFRVYAYNYEIIWQEFVNFVVKYIWQIREDILSKIRKIYTKNEAIFLWWILVWARENLPETLSTNFNNSWLTHLIAVSGFNITILIIFFGFIAKYFPPFIRFIFISTIILLFTILVWFGAPVVRAAIMWIIWYFAVVSWRQSNILAVIIFTLILMITYSPLSINYDASLHLSFLAVLWIIYTEKFFEKVFKFIPEMFEIRTATSITISALIFTFPIMMFNFWQVSIIAPLSNVLVTWTIPIVMFIWFISIIFYSIFPILWMIVGYFARILLRWDILIVNIFWEFDYSIIKYDFWEYSWYLEVLYFMVLIFVILWFKAPLADEK